MGSSWPAAATALVPAPAESPMTENALFASRSNTRMTSCPASILSTCCLIPNCICQFAAKHRSQAGGCCRFMKRFNVVATKQNQRRHLIDSWRLSSDSSHLVQKLASMLLALAKWGECCTHGSTTYEPLIGSAASSRAATAAESQEGDRRGHNT